MNSVLVPPVLEMLNRAMNSGKKASNSLHAPVKSMVSIAVSLKFGTQMIGIGYYKT